MITIRLIEKLTFEKRFEKSEYLRALLYKALSQELAYSVGEIARSVEYNRGRVQGGKVRELREGRVRLCRANRASGSYSYRIK